MVGWFMKHKVMSFRPGRRFALVGKLADDVLGDRPFPPPVLGEDHGNGRFNVYDFDPCPVVRKQVDPSLPSLAQQVGGTEGEWMT